MKFMSKNVFPTAEPCCECLFRLRVELEFDYWVCYAITFFFSVVSLVWNCWVKVSIRWFYACKNCSCWLQRIFSSSPESMMKTKNMLLCFLFFFSFFFKSFMAGSNKQKVFFKEKKMYVWIRLFLFLRLVRGSQHGEKSHLVRQIL